jgi:hypothetical protein
MSNATSIHLIKTLCCVGGVQMEVDLIVGELKNRKFFLPASA